MKTPLCSPPGQRARRRLRGPLILVFCTVVALLAFAGSELRVLDLERLDTNNNWQLRWTAVPGSNYHVQRLVGDAFSSNLSFLWTNIATVFATGEVASFKEIVPTNITQRFYRIALITNWTGDEEAPVIQWIQAAVVSNDLSALRLTFSATDDTGVMSVTVQEGTNSLGQAAPTTGNLWTFSVPPNGRTNQARFFSATARDAAGNEGHCGPIGLLGADPDRFAPVGPEGSIREGQALLAPDSNRVSDFVFRPGGRPRPGAAPDFYLRFTNGAGLLNSNGQTVLEFERVAGAFPPESPFQLANPLARSAGETVRWPAGPLSFADLAGWFGVNPEEGLPLIIFGRYPVRWRGGVLDDRGLSGGQFHFDTPDLPLPDWSGTCVAPVLDLSSDRALRIPFAGEFELADGTANAARVRVRCASPLWLTLLADGHLSLRGPAEVYWPNGASVLAQLDFDDPQYRLALSASGLRVQGLSNLVQVLPDNPAGCVPAGSDPAQLAQATVCLDKHLRAYTHFNAAVAASASNSPASSTPLADYVNLTGDVLEAWGHSAAAKVTPALPLGQVVALASHFGHQAAAAPELPEVLAYRQALLRARAAVQAGALSGSEADRQQLDLALREAEAAALARARSPDATLSLASMTRAARMLLDSETLRQTFDPNPSSLLLDALPPLLEGFADHLANAYAITNGVFSPSANPRVRDLNRFTAMEVLRQILEVQADAQMLGVTLDPDIHRLDELSAQLGARLCQTVTNALTQAEAAGDLPAFNLAAQDYLELISWSQVGVFPSIPELAALEDPSVLPDLGTRLAAVMAADFARPYGERSLGRQATDMRALLRVLREVPPSITYPLSAVQRAYDQMEARLSNSVPWLETNAVNLVEWLEAGTLHRELGARFDLPQTANWESDRLPQVVTRLASVAFTTRAWRELDQATRQLLNAADRAGLSGDQLLRRAYLAQAAVLLSASRQVAVGLMQDAGGLFRTLDFVLPGEVLFEEPAGCAIYNRETGDFHAAAQGRLRLPRWSLALTVQNAAFDNGGHFDLSAYGQLLFAAGQLNVPARQPLHFWYAPEQGPALEGTAQLRLGNGLRFDSSISLVDPIYQFGLAARGLELDLGRQMVLHRPVLDSAVWTQFGEATRDAFGDYLHDLNGSLETLVNCVTNYPVVDPNGFGQPPEFVPPEITLDFMPLNAWANDILARSRAGLNQGYSNSLGEVIEAIRRLNHEADELAAGAGQESARWAALAGQIQARIKVAQAGGALGQSAPVPAPRLGGKAPAEAADSGGDLATVLALSKAGGVTVARAAAELVTQEVVTNLPKARQVAILLYQAAAMCQTNNIPDPVGNPSGDPCADATEINNGLCLLQRAAALSACSARYYAMQIGVNPDTGQVTDTNLFNRLNADAVESSVMVLLELEAVGQAGGSTNTVMPAMTPLVLRDLQLVREELAASTNWLYTHQEVSSLEGANAVRSKLARLYFNQTRLMDAAALLQSGIVDIPDGTAQFEELANEVLGAQGAIVHSVTRGINVGLPLDSARQEASEARQVRQRQRRTQVDHILGRDRDDAKPAPVRRVLPRENHEPSFWTLLTDFLKRMSETLPDFPPPIFAEVVLPDLNNAVSAMALDLRARAAGAGLLSGGLQEAQSLLNTIAGLTDWAGTYMPGDLITQTNLQVALSNLTFQFKALAEAERAWWLLDRYQETLRLHTAIYGTNLVAGYNEALREARGASLQAEWRVADAFSNLLSQVRYEDVVLPLPGQVRVPNVFGRLYYNRVSGFLEGCFGGRIEFPELGSNVVFEITEACLASDGSYHIGATTATPLPFGSARLVASLNVTNTAVGQASFAGNGTLTIVTNGANAQVFAVAITYESEGERLACSAAGTQLDFRLGNDFALFNAGLGFEVTGAEPGGAFYVQGSAGLYARDRDHPLPPVLSATNFHLLVTNLSASFHYGSEGAEVVLSNGLVVLPEFFRAGDCAGAGPGGPAVALSPSRPLQVVYRHEPPPGLLTVDGQLHLTNLSVSVPFLDGLGADLCYGTLILASNDLPVLTNLAGSLRIPLPPGQTNQVAFTHAAWSLNGFPNGDVLFTNDLIGLLETNGFSFSLVGTACGGAGLSVSSDSGAPVFTIAGGIEVGLPLDMLSGVQGDRVSALACGAVHGSGQGVSVELDQVTLTNGTFHLGGQSGVLVSNAWLTVSNLGSLFDWDDARPVGAALSGTVFLPNGITGSLTEAGFSFARVGGQVIFERFTAGGMLSLPDGGPSFQASLSYVNSTRTFSFDSSASDLRLELAPDFVIFDASLGFTLAGSGDAQLRAGGSAGLFATGEPPPGDFHLVITNLVTALTFSGDLVSLTLSNGTLYLPDVFTNGPAGSDCGSSGSPGDRAAVVLNPLHPIELTILADGSASFTGDVSFNNLDFVVPGLEDFLIEICHATLHFAGNSLPALRELDARLSIPMPNQPPDGKVLLNLTGVELPVNGLPSGTVSLGSPVTLVNLDGLFQLDVLAGSSLTLSNHNHQPIFILAGGVRGTFDKDLLQDGESLQGLACESASSLTWRTGQLPEFQMGTVTFAGSIKLGGLTLMGVNTNGIPDPSAMASITLVGITNLIQGKIDTSRTFEVVVSGAIGVAETFSFGLKGARFTFDGQPPEPQFGVQSLGFATGTSFPLWEVVPFQITDGSVVFQTPSLPLPEMLAPANLLFTLSGSINISLGEGDNAPRLYGAVDNLAFTLPQGFSGPPEFQINTLMLELQNLAIGDMVGLTGGVAVGNLNDPPNLFFAGEVGGGYNGVGITAIVALRLDGLLGLCLKASAGPAGIPLDGGAVGGILLSGAEGGVSFANQFADPCDFKAYLGLNEHGQPAGSPALAGRPAAAPALDSTSIDESARLPVSRLSALKWDDLGRLQKLHEQTKALRAAGMTPLLQQPASPGASPQSESNGQPCTCPTCPPKSMNVLCQRHPSAGQSPSDRNYNGKYANNVIFKFSSLDRATVDQILRTANIDLSGSAGEVAARFAAEASQTVSNVFFPLLPWDVHTDWATNVIDSFTEGLNGMRTALADALQAALQAAAGEGRTPLEAVYEAAYGGVKCVDITIQLKGTFTYAPVSVALSGTGGAVASTTGAAGLLGSINLFGLPIGWGELFFTVTDEQGRINPAVCGQARAALGPLDLGQMCMNFQGPSVDGTLQALAGFMGGMAGDLDPTIRGFITNVAYKRLVLTNGIPIATTPLTSFFGPTNAALLTAQEQVAVMASILDVSQFIQSANNPQAWATLYEAALDLILAIHDTNNPSLMLCGEVDPRLFGFSLTGGNALVSASFLANKTNLAGTFSFSPSYVFGNLAFALPTLGMVNNVVPALDQAGMGFRIPPPELSKPTLRLLTTNAAQFAADQLDRVLDGATLTAFYEINPLGLKLASAQGRVVLPTVAHHPDNPARLLAWELPTADERAGPGGSPACGADHQQPGQRLLGR